MRSARSDFTWAAGSGFAVVSRRSATMSQPFSPGRSVSRSRRRSLGDSTHRTAVASAALAWSDSTRRTRRDSSGATPSRRAARASTVTGTHLGPRFSTTLAPGAKTFLSASGEPKASAPK